MDFSIIFNEVLRSETVVTGFAYAGTIFLGIVLCAVILPLDLVMLPERTIHNKNHH